MQGQAFLAGGTGVVGRHLAPALRDHGWHVRALINQETAAEALPEGVEPALGDLLDPSVSDLAAGCELIVHAASAIPKQRDAPPEAWELNDRTRREGTRHLIRAAQANEVRFLLQSVTMLYADGGTAWIDAGSARIDPAPNVESMLDAEQMLFESRVPSLILRQGLLFGDKFMTVEPYRNAQRVFVIVDNGSAHRGKASIKRVQGRYKNLILIHTPVHASWLNQAVIYFSIVQRKVLTPNDFTNLDTLEQQLLAFGRRYEQIATPFEWKFTRTDLDRLAQRLELPTPRAA